ncbi:Sialic acid transporter (permease) NanT [Acidisarcina polymorpha]|uniref:Sialic acid transporter (Permease) NanT n=1 Tax=Acidisarcina polymorpha TaxID=2211140 RepID=A0A2Z5FTL0_9BACT|nr:MFS transporter [Acidisarcina polymorpha]AXC09837.1 Sialic acid transporter (permease) NanT [Acidisarcina polymorpha]
MKWHNYFRSISSAQRHAFFACLLGWTMDAFDFFILVFCVSAIARDFHARVPAVTQAIFLTLAFRPVGALLFGALADRYGRRPALMINIGCFSVLELACAFAPSLHVLLILRALFGVAMGGEWGVGAALALESLPKESRGFFSGLLQEGYALGYLLAALAYTLLFHFIGWRGMFIVGAAPAVLVAYIGLKVEESPVWVEGRIRQAAATVRPTFGANLRRYGLTFLFLILLMTGFNGFSHGTQDLYPTFLEHDHLLSPAATGSIAIVYTIGMILGGITVGTLSERFGRKPAIIGAVLLSIPIIPLFALSHPLWLLIPGAFLMQFMVQGAWGVIPAYLSELSPEPVRATFPGLAYQLGNLITSRNSVLQAEAAVRFGGYRKVLALTVLIGAVYLALVTSFGRESRGADLSAS